MEHAVQAGQLAGTEKQRQNQQKILMLVQHTESEHHVNGMIGSGYEWHLTGHGKEQAREIGRALLREDCGNAFRMISSSMVRARETAEAINESLRLPLSFDDRIREINAGEGSGKPRDWYQTHKAPAPVGYDPDHRDFPDGESDRDLWDRVWPFYEELMNSDQERLIIVSHGSTLSFLISMLCGDSFPDIARRKTTGPAGSVSRIVIAPDGRRLIHYINRKL